MSFLLRNKIRLTLFALGILGAVFAPPYVPLLAMGALALRYTAWEALFIGALVDLLWLPDISAVPFFTIVALVLVWGLVPLRRELLANA